MDRKEFIEKCIAQGMTEAGANALADSLGLGKKTAAPIAPTFDLEGLAEKVAAKMAQTVKLPDDLSGQIDEAVAKAIKDKGLDKVLKNAIPGAGELPEPETKEALKKAFILGVLKSGMPNAQLTDLQRKALSEGTDSAGGYMVPTEHRSEIIMRLPELSELFPYVRRVPVISDAGNFPKLDTDVSITWGRSENAAITESDPTLTQLAFSIVNASAITNLSRELVADSNPGIVEFVTRLFSEAIAAERDKKIAMGTGSSQPEGIFSASGVSAISGTSGALTYGKLVALKFGLKRKYQRKARFMMNSTTLGWCHKLTDDNGQPILRDALVAGESPRILGKEYSIQDDIDDGLVGYGDLSQYFWFDRQQMLIESTTTGGDAFSKHQLSVKVIERCDGKVALGEGFKKSGTFTDPG